MHESIGGFFLRLGPFVNWEYVDINNDIGGGIWGGGRAEGQELVFRRNQNKKKMIFIFPFYKKKYVDQGTAQMNKELRFSRGRRFGGG
jgi:hypothetical protein